MTLENADTPLEGTQASLVAMLRSASSLQGLADHALTLIAETASIRSHLSGEMLIRKGDLADTLYLVLTGRFRVVNEAATIAMIGPGEPIGELAFFAGGRRTADVVAMRDSTVLELDRQGYEALVAADPALAATILATVSARLAAVTARAVALPPQAGRVMTLIAAGTAPLPEALIDGLQAAARRHGGLCLHDGSTAPVDAGPAALAEWMRALETAGGRHLLVVRDADAHPVWAGFAAGSADSLIVAGTLERPEPPRPGGIEARASDAAYRPVLQLVLWRDRADQPIRGTPAWLAGRDVALHHHLALDRPADFERLVRFCCDQARGLVLAGGGAFGTAHLGAFKALQEEGIAIDFIGGTSVGAAMAAALAKGLDIDEIMDRCNDIFVANRAMGRLTAPLYSILNHRVFDDQLERHFGTDPVEDVPLNFFAVASSLSRNAPHVIRSGPLWKAVRASGSIPALLPPVLTDDGEVLIDGGLFDNLPLQVMRQLKSGPNIALDFPVAQNWRVDADYTALPRPVRAAAGLIMGRIARPARVRRFPRIASVLSRAMTMNSRRLIAETDLSPDVLIELPVRKGASFLDWTRSHDHFHHANRLLRDALAQAEPNPADGTAPTSDAVIERLRAAASILGQAA
jgi:NTE family protein